MSASRVYADVISQKPDDYSEYEQMLINWSPDRYELIETVGRGKFSEVYKAYDKQEDEYVSIKHLKPVRRRKIRKEIKIMLLLKDGPNILPIFDMVKDPESNSPNIVTKWVDTMPYKEFYAGLSDYEFRFYLYKVLIGLDYAHSCGIMHRDIKPQNILIDYKTRDVFIIDWGLAEFYIANKSYNVRVSTRNYKGPELLTNNDLYHYSVDMWSFGCMIAGIVFSRLPFFRARDNVEQLRRITDVLGTDRLFSYINKYSLNVDQDVLSKIGTCRKRDWDEFAVNGHSKFICTDLYDMLDSLLIYDHNDRLTAQECMIHPYFDLVRDDVLKESLKQETSIENELQNTLMIFEEVERGIRCRTQYEVSLGNYELVNALCATLKTLEYYLQLLRQNPTEEVINEAKLFYTKYERNESSGCI